MTTTTIFFWKKRGRRWVDLDSLLLALERAKYHDVARQLQGFWDQWEKEMGQ